MKVRILVLVIVAQFLVMGILAFWASEAKRNAERDFQETQIFLDLGSERPMNETDYWQMGIHHQEHGFQDEADFCFEKAIRLNPSCASWKKKLPTIPGGVGLLLNPTEALSPNPPANTIPDFPESTNVNPLLLPLKGGTHVIRP